MVMISDDVHDGETVSCKNVCEIIVTWTFDHHHQPFLLSHERCCLHKCFDHTSTTPQSFCFDHEKSIVLKRKDLNLRHYTESSSDELVNNFHQHSIVDSNQVRIKSVNTLSVVFCSTSLAMHSVFPIRVDRRSRWNHREVHWWKFVLSVSKRFTCFNQFSDGSPEKLTK